MPHTNRVSRHDRPGDADRHGYHPNVFGDWSSPEPKTVQQALDDLAAAVTSGALPVPDTTALVKGNTDATKQVRLEADGLSASMTRVITMPDNDVDLGTDFAPASHNHNTSDINAGLLALARGGANADVSTFLAGELVRLNAGGTALESAGVKASDLADIRVRVYNASALSIAHNTWTTLTFDSERWDTDGMHDVVTNTSRLTVQTAGQYLFILNVAWAPNITSIRQVGFKLNGTTWIAFDTKSVGDTATFNMDIETLYQMAVGDYVECFVLQKSGGSLNINSAGNRTPEFSAVRIPGT